MGCLRRRLALAQTLRPSKPLSVFRLRLATSLAAGMVSGVGSGENTLLASIRRVA